MGVTLAQNVTQLLPGAGPELDADEEEEESKSNKLPEAPFEDVGAAALGTEGEVRGDGPPPGTWR